MNLQKIFFLPQLIVYTNRIGIPELGLEPIEPLVIPRLGMTNGQGNVRVNAIFTDINCRGAGSYNVTKASANIKNYRLDLQLALPKVELRGQYNVTGQVLVLPIQSYGQFWARIGKSLEQFFFFINYFCNNIWILMNLRIIPLAEKISAIARIQGVEFLRDNVRYMRISRMLVDFKLGKTAFRIDDALNRNNVIGQAMNQFLNENSNEIIEEMRKPASESIAKHFQGFLNQAFEKLPLKVWLRDT